MSDATDQAAIERRNHINALVDQAPTISARQREHLRRIFTLARRDRSKSQAAA